MAMEMLVSDDTEHVAPLGKVHLEGSAHPPRVPPAMSPHQRAEHRELIRLMMQSMSRLGYHSSATHLAQETGVSLEHPVLQKLRPLVRRGQFDSAVSVLSKAQDFMTEENASKAVLTLHIQSYLELLEAGNIEGAMRKLQKGVTPCWTVVNKRDDSTSVSGGEDRNAHALGAGFGTLYAGPTDGRKEEDDAKSEPDLAEEDDILWFDRSPASLAMLALCSSPVELLNAVDWDGASVQGRLQVIERIESLASDQSCLPSGRLETLLEQAKKEQVRSCRFHNVDGDVSFIAKDHVCSCNAVPQRCAQVLTWHRDEVWCVDISPDGRLLASCDASGVVLICTLPSVLVKPDASSSDIPPVTVLHRLVLPAAGGPVVLTWSPDSSRLLCAFGRHAAVWKASSGQEECNYETGKGAVLAAAWIDNAKFAVGGVGKHLTLWSVESGCVCSWETGRINSLHSTADGSRVVALSTETRLMTLDIKSGSCWFNKGTMKPGMSMDVTHDGRLACVCLRDQARLQLWDLSKGTLTLAMKGYTQQRFSRTPTFGGVDQRMIACGSEDGHVMVWLRSDGELVATLQGHAGNVNSVAWSQTNPQLLASASDDCTVRLWLGHA